MRYFVTYLVAVCTGVSANLFVGIAPLKAVSGTFYMGNPLFAFNLAMVALALKSLYVVSYWNVNYGESHGALEAIADFPRSAHFIATTPKTK